MLTDSMAVLQKMHYSIILKVTMTEMKGCLQHSLNNGRNFSWKYLLWNVFLVAYDIKSK